MRDFIAMKSFNINFIEKLLSILSSYDQKEWEKIENEIDLSHLDTLDVDTFLYTLEESLLPCSSEENSKMYKFLKDRQPIYLRKEALDEPVTLKKDGTVATVQDILNKGPVPYGEKFFSVRDLNPEQLVQLSLYALDFTSETRRYASLSGEDLSKDEMKEQVQKQTHTGCGFIDSVQRNSIFMEEALKMGKIKIKDEKTVLFQSFDF